MARRARLHVWYAHRLCCSAWFWKKPQLLKARLIAKFGSVALSEREQSRKVSLAPLVSMAPLLRRFLQLSGIQLRSGLRDSADLHEPFVTSDFALVPRITEMDIASLAVAEQYRRQVKRPLTAAHVFLISFLQAKRKVGSNKYALLQSAAEILSKAVISNPRQLSNRLRWVRVLVSMLRFRIRNGVQFGDTELAREIARVKSILHESAAIEAVPAEAQFLESSLLRQEYHQHMNVDGADALLSCLGFWAQSYALLMKSHSNGVLLHIGLNIRARFARRKAKRWAELLVGLESFVQFGKVDQVVLLLSNIIAADVELASFLLASLDGPPRRLRIVSVLMEIFRPHATLTDMLRTWLSARPKIKITRMTFEFCCDATVAKFLALCDENVTRLSLANCIHITDDVGLMFARMPNLRELSLSNCPHLTDEGVLTFIPSLQRIEVLDLSQCVRLTDHCLSRMRLPALQSLDVTKCISVNGEFLARKGFMRVHSLWLDECHRISRTSLSRLSTEAFPSLTHLSLRHLACANSQVCIAAHLMRASDICTFHATVVGNDSQALHAPREPRFAQYGGGGARVPSPSEQFGAFGSQSKRRRR